MNSETQVPLARPEWNHEDYFREQFKDVTVLICQRKTRDLIQLCVTSILNHYPEIKILVVDGNSQDDSTEWLRFMAAKYPNVKLWERPEGRNSHGETMHEAMAMIETKYVLLMDSDTIVRRGGFVEKMLNAFYLHWPITANDEIKAAQLYAIGSLMLQSIKGEACSQPESEEDVLRYAHPSCSMYDVEIYRTLRPFTDHGAPCALNNIDAQNKGYAVEYFPADKYVQHLCGASWQDIPTVWNDDGDVQIRPLVTFICGQQEGFEFISMLSGDDFDIITCGHSNPRKASTYDRGILEFNNSIYDIRFKVSGHYVCHLSLPGLYDFHTPIHDLIEQIRNAAIKNPEAAEFIFEGLKVIERKHWQKYNSLT